MMRKRIFTHITPLLFIAAFLAPRVANLHALSHLSSDDISISCELCDVVVYSYLLDLVTDHLYGLEDNPQNTPSNFVAFAYYDMPQEKIVSPTSIHNKPPPIL